MDFKVFINMGIFSGTRKGIIFQCGDTNVLTPFLAYLAILKFNLP